jgi:hypothetical protein
MLCLGVDMDLVIERVLSYLDDCQYNPFKMLPAVEDALEDLVPLDGHITCSKRVSVSLTGIQASITRPLYSVRVSKFVTRKHLIDALRASCHIPVRN